MAQPVATCPVDVRWENSPETTQDDTPLLGQTYYLRYRLDNTGTQTGFLPGVEIELPPEHSIIDAEGVGQSATYSQVGIFPASGQLNHPDTNEVITGTPGNSLWWVLYPISSQPPSAPEFEMFVHVQTTNDATFETLMDIKARCGYYYGTDALNNSATDPVVNTNADTTLTVVLMDVRRFSPKHCQGSSHVAASRITFDLAAGASLGATTMTISLDSDFQYTGYNGPGTVVSAPAGLGGQLVIDLPALAGMLGVDMSISVEGYVPVGKITQTNPTPYAYVHAVELHGQSGLGSNYDITTNAGTQSVNPLVSSLTGRVLALAVFETITVVGGGVVASGSTLDFDVRVCVADDFTKDMVHVVSDHDDGLTYVAGSSTWNGGATTAPVITGLGPQFLDHDLGTLAPSTDFLLEYQMTVNETYNQTGIDIRAGDVFTTRHTVSGDVSGSAPPLTCTDTESSGGGNDDFEELPDPVLTKVTTPLIQEVRAGDVVTFDLKFEILNGDEGATVLTDYLPQPIFDAMEVSGETIGPMGGATKVRYGPDHNLPQTAHAVNVDAANNAFFINMPDVSSVGVVSKTFHVLIDMTVGTGPFEDGFGFSNIMSTVETSTGYSDLTSFDMIIRVPELEAEKTATVTTGDAGDTISYTVTVTNTGGDSAHDVELSDILPADVSFVGGTLAVTEGDGTTAVPFTGDLFTSNLDLTNAIPKDTGGTDHIILIKYDVVLDNSVNSGDQLINKFVIEQFASAPSGPNHASPNETSHTVTISPFVVDKSRLGVEAYTWGQEAVYTIDITVPEGTHSPFNLRDRLPAGLGFVGFENIQNPDGLLCGGVLCETALAGAVPTVTGTTNGFTTIDVALGDIVNPADSDVETLSLDVRVIADGASTAAAGLNFRNFFWVNLRYRGDDSTLDISDPTLTASTTLSGPAALDAGETVTVSSVLATFGSPFDAHDVVFSIDLTGEKIANQTGTVSLGAGCPAGVVTSDTATLVTVTFALFPTGTNCQVDFDTTVLDSVVHPETINVANSIAYDSQSGSPAEQRAYGRTANSNNLTTTGATSVAKAFVSSSDASTADPAIAIGETAVYQLTVTVPEGTTNNLTVTDDPPPGLKIVGVSFDTSAFVGAITPPAGPTSGTTGQALTWAFGNVVATGSAGGQDDNTFTIDVTVQGTLDPAMTAAGSNNVATTAENGTTEGNATVPVTLALPQPSIGLTIDDNTPSATQTANLNAVITNGAGAGPICNTTFTVAVPAGFTIESFTADGLDNDLDATTDEADEASLVSGNTITFPVVGCINGGASLMFPFQATAASTITPATVNFTGTLGNYDTLAAGGETIAPTADLHDNNGVAGVDEAADATTTLPVTPSAPSFTFTKAAIDENGPLLEPGDFVTYSIKLENTGTGPSAGIEIKDIVPTTNVTYVAGSETVVGSAGVTASDLSIAESGGTVVATLSPSSLPAGESITVTFRMELDDPLAVGSQVTNQATARSTDPQGFALLSDDPATAAADDPTVIATASTNDLDGDGVPNASDTDPNDPSVCSDIDSDGCDDCSIANLQQVGNDGDDLDGDGQCDLGDDDDDNDGIPDNEEGPDGVDPSADADGDGIPNYLDVDDDGTIGGPTCTDVAAPVGECDVIDPKWDTDGDGVPNHLDLDSDNDGIPDVVEGQSGCADLDLNGICDGPFNSDGIATDATNPTPPDTDGDGIPDFQDLDSDNDGIPDVLEGGSGCVDTTVADSVCDGPDTDGDGIVDSIDGGPAGYGDGDGTGVPPNSDSDATPNYLDLDSDNDGLSDVVEGESGCFDVAPEDQVCDGPDTDGDGVVDTIDDVVGFGDPPVVPTDTDSDMNPDYIEIDSDNDGNNDTDDSNCDDSAPADGQCDGPDTDGDGIVDQNDPTVGFGAVSDIDGDGIPDALDEDDDNDGILDVDETPNGVDPNLDSDGDNIPDYLDADDNGSGTAPACTDAAPADGVCDVVDAIWDTDGDGVPDHIDLDADNDGIPDVIEGGSDCADADSDGICDGPFGGNGVATDATGPLADTDGDGVPDFQDLDSDNDGISDLVEGGSGCTDAAPVDGVCDGPDGDGDGIVDSIDPADSFGDDDGVVTPTDTDMDGVDDYQDLDSDNDGILDVTEGNSGCTDGPPTDGVCDGPDTDGDGIPDSVDDGVGFGDPVPPVLPDADMDGVPDNQEVDSDNDGVNDNVLNGCIDVAMDGQCDGVDVDGDGIIDQVDEDTTVFGSPVLDDTDGDGIPDLLDVDDDNDGILDTEEGPAGVDPTADVDGDGVPNWADSDNDGTGTAPTCADTSPADGACDTIDPQFDTDGDGIPDANDLDSDNDGLPDSVEGASGCVDAAAADGICDGPFDPTGLATDATNAVPVDSDMDGVPDFQDLDSDNDGATDLEEVGSGCTDTTPTDGVCDGPDADGDGIVDSIDPGSSFGDDDGSATPANDDTDAAPNYLDDDSDGDGIPDIVEAGTNCADTAPADGECDGPDADGDGLVDTVDPNPAFGGGPPAVDTDGDGIPDIFDLDSDNDGILDSDEGTEDLDGDGIPDYLDLDSDNDGISDLVENQSGCADVAPQDNVCDGPIDADGVATDATTGVLVDTDGDGVPDVIDLDSDNDGIPDIAEGQSGCTDAAPVDGMCDGPDTDGDGIVNDIDELVGHGDPDVDGTPDTDGDGVPDMIDLDSDNDGIPDIEEGDSGCEDADKNGVCDGPDADGDGIADSIDDSPNYGDTMPAIPADTDGDGDPDYVDLDSDNDGTPDLSPDCEDVAPADDMCDGPDSDGDGGVDDIDDHVGFGLGSDTDGDGVPDVDDLDDDNDGILDVDEGDETIDTDGDGVPDSLDLDSDNDGIPDAYESGNPCVDTTPQDSVCDGPFDSDGVVDTAVDDPVDTDGDGMPDFQDLDADGDGIPDIIEGDVDCDDADGDNQCDGADTDGDGIPDSADQTNGFGDTDVNDPPDTDGDGAPDFQDEDADGDGVPDIDEGLDDPDGDGVPNYLDEDSDNDGFLDGTGLSGGGCTSGNDFGWLAMLLLLGFMRRRKTVVGVLAFATAMQASAQTPTDFSVERFRLSNDRTGILDTESADVSGHGTFELSSWLGYANDPFVAYSTVGGDRTRLGSLVSDRVGLSLMGAVSLWEKVQIAVDVPLVLNQQDSDTGNILTAPSSGNSFGLGDIRVALKLQLLDHDSVDIALQVAGRLPTSTEVDYSGESKGALEAELIFSKRFSDTFRAAFDLGYRLREDHQVLNLLAQDEFYGHLGLAAAVSDQVELQLSVSAATAVKDAFGKFNTNHIEPKLGIVYEPNQSWALFAAAGMGLSEGYGTPDWRVLGGLRYTNAKDSEPAPAAVEPAPPAPVDTDGDGIYDHADKCPEKPETKNDFEDEDGCPDEVVVADTDGDGILDDKDKCRDTPEDKDNFQDEDGCPEADNDGDGVVDAVDKCPLKSGPADNSGCPHSDRDNDTVVDKFDVCPDKVGKPEWQGCPKDPKVKITSSGIQIVEKIYFRTGKDRIRSRSFGILRNVARVLLSHPEIIHVIVEGHTDSRGSARSNKRLSQRRADAVVMFLITEGVSPARLEAQGWGEERPKLEDARSRSEHAQNRRVEFVIPKTAGIQQNDNAATSDTIDR